MDKCCRWCRYYDNATGYCNHEEMFEIEELSSYGTNIRLLDIYDDSDEFGADTHELEGLGFKVKSKEEFSCCYWE